MWGGGEAGSRSRPIVADRWLSLMRPPISKAEGTSPFMLVEGTEDGSEEPLSNDVEIECACTSALCVKPEEEWECDMGFELIKDKVFELKLAQGDSVCREIYCGVVRDRASCNEMHWKRESTVGWGMFSLSGGLFGNGKDDDDSAGKIESDQVLTMQVDTDADTLKCWLDGKPHGPGYPSGVTVPLCWATTLRYTAHTGEIVPTTELQ